MPGLHQPRPLTPERRDGNSPLRHLSRPYYREGAGDDLESPAEIIARIHAAIAAQSPEHAQLVADYERVREETGLVILGDGHQNILKTSKETRVRQYAEARAEGKSRSEAAEAIGVSLCTAGKYEAELRRAAAGEAA